MNKDYKGEVEYILTSQLIHHQAHASSSSGINRRKSVISDFFQSGSRRPSHMHNSNSSNALQVDTNNHDNDDRVRFYIIQY